MIIAFILVIVAALFKAIADRIANHDHTVSIFKEGGFWLKQGRFIPLTKYKLDGWHLSNSIMICSLVGLIFSNITFQQWYLYPILGIVWIIIFNFFYNQILKK